MHVADEEHVLHAEDTCAASQEIRGAGDTTTATQGELQLFPSFDSTIDPTLETLVSAHARTYHVPADGKV